MTWETYFNNTRNVKPSSLLMLALPWTTGKTALDLGAGALRDTKLLLKEGFDVVSVDSSPLIKNEAVGLEGVTIINSTFQDFFTSNDKKFNLITAQFALPFNPRKSFDKVWKSIYNSLRPDGIFTGQLFGLNDEWNESGSLLCYHSEEEVSKLLRRYHTIRIAEIEEEKATAVDSATKHWHYFEFIAKRNSKEQ